MANKKSSSWFLPVCLIVCALIAGTALRGMGVDLPVIGK